MRSFRSFVGSAAVCGCLLASGLFVGGVAAQIAEPGGGPLQLLKLTHPGRSQATPHAKLVAKSAAKSATKLSAKSAVKSAAKSSAKSSAKISARPAIKPSAKTRLASRKKPRSHIAVAARKRHEVPATVHTASAAPSDWPAAPTAIAADATTLSPVQQMPAAPPIMAPTAGTPSALVVDGQTIQVASADEANEIDLTGNGIGIASAASLGPKLASNAPTAAMTEPAVKSDATSAATMAPAPRSEAVSTTPWILQVLAALGGAVAAGSVAWFLMGSAPQRTYG